jgi:4-hydroxy-3-polyprenylbenzoate decarboxylase
MRLIVGISGASGAIYGIRLLELLAGIEGVETHLVMSNSAKITINSETDWEWDQVEALADEVHSIKNIGATIASGSFKTAGMVIAPCSMKTLSAVVNSYADNLLTRAADVILKEKRKLVLMVRETPLHLGHCKLMYEACNMGAILYPPVPAFYARPDSLEDMIDHSVGRVLDLFDIEVGKVNRWQGLLKNDD